VSPARKTTADVGVDVAPVTPFGGSESRTSRYGRQIAALPPASFFVVSAVFHYLGPSFAVLLFQHIGVLGVAWLRIASAALVFALWLRP
jgi:inner membrane transporter RhtA